MAEDGQAEHVDTELPEALQHNLRRARRLHNRAMRAPVRSNGRTKLLERSRKWISVAMGEAAAEGIAVKDLPEWARRNFDAAA